MPTGKPTKMKPCKICGDMFLPDTPSSKICHKAHLIPCPICGNMIEWNSTREVEPCSKDCRKEATRRKNIQKYGVEHPMQSKVVQQNHRRSMLEKYGVESPLQSQEIRDRAIASNREKFGTDWALGNQEVHDKIRNTMNERYGVNYSMQSDELKEKSRQTCLERYGVEHSLESQEVRLKIADTMIQKYGAAYPMQVPEIAQKVSEDRKQHTEEILNKAKQTWMSTLGVDNPSKSPQVIDKMTQTFISRYGVKRAIQLPEFRQKMIDTMIARYGVEYYTQSKELDHIRISIINKKFSHQLDELGIRHELEFYLARKSYDIRLLDERTLIEIDPTYTHNAVGNHWDSEGIAEDYHLSKTKLANEAGYRCIHIFDWDDQEKILNMFIPKKAIYARKCTIFILKQKVANDFLDSYHLQGKCRGQVLCLGLVYEGELYQVMTFGRSRYDKKFEVELLRLCTRPGYTVVGGASKLFQFAVKTYEIESVISYCDLSKFSGNVYEQIGMHLLRVTPPQEVWSRGEDKITANLLRQRGYDQLFGTNHGKGTSNELLMLQNGWLPVYDCGQAVFEYRSK